MTTREQIIAAAKEAGCHSIFLGAQMVSIESLERFYAIAFTVGAASRDAEIGMLITYLEYISSGELGPKICAALAKDALAKMRKP